MTDDKEALTDMLERVARVICRAQTQGEEMAAAFVPEARAAIDAYNKARQQEAGEYARIWRCNDCGFGFDAAHEDEPGGGYTCPLCERDSDDGYKAKLARAEFAEAELDKLKERIMAAKVALFPSPVKNSDGSTTSGDAAHNLAGALYDLENDGVDRVCIDTIKRVLAQIVLAGNALEKDDG